MRKRLRTYSNAFLSCYNASTLCSCTTLCQLTCRTYDHPTRAACESSFWTSTEQYETSRDRRVYSVAGRPAVVLIVNLYQSAHVLSRSRVSYCRVSLRSSARPASQMPPNYADSVVCAVCWIKHLLSRTGVKSRVRVSKDAAAPWDPPDASHPTLDRHSQLFCVIFRWAVREAKFKGETEKCGSK